MFPPSAGIMGLHLLCSITSSSERDEITGPVSGIQYMVSVYTSRILAKNLKGKVCEIQTEME
jgi:hypothetical protein